MQVITRVGRKGVIVIPKKLRESLGIKEGSHVTMEIRDNAIVIKPFKLRRVKLGGKASQIVARLKREEIQLED